MSESYTSEANVEKAILSLLVKNVNPSVNAIREEISVLLGFEDGKGRGSPNEILVVKQRWQSKVQEKLEIPTPKHIPEKALANFESVWDMNQALAAKEFEEEKKQLLESLAHLKIDLEITLNAINLKDEEIGKSAEVIAAKVEVINQLDERIALLTDQVAGQSESIKMKEQEIAVLNEQIIVNQDSIAEQEELLLITKKKLEDTDRLLENEASNHERELERLNNMLSEKDNLIQSSNEATDIAQEKLQCENEKARQLETDNYKLIADINNKSKDLEYVGVDKDKALASLKLAEDMINRGNEKLNLNQANYDKLMDRYSDLSEKYSALVEQVLSNKPNAKV